MKGRIGIDENGNPIFLGYDDEEDEISGEDEYLGDGEYIGEDEYLGEEDYLAGDFEDVGQFPRMRRMMRRLPRFASRTRRAMSRRVPFARPTGRKAITLPLGGGRSVRKDIPQMDVRMRQKDTGQFTGLIRCLSRGNNEVSGAGGLLVANTANTDSLVFRATVPQNRKWHFKPQYAKGRDANITSFLLLLRGPGTTDSYLDGTYQIMAWNANHSGLRGVLASGALAKHAYDTTVVASLNDIDLRVYYIRDLILTEGDVVEVWVNASTVLNTEVSNLWMEFVELVP